MSAKLFKDMPDQFPTANTSPVLGLLDGDAVDIHGVVNRFLDQLPKTVDKAIASFMGALLLSRTQHE